MRRSTLVFCFRRGKQDSHLGDQFRLAGDNHHRVVFDRQESAIGFRQHDATVGVDSHVTFGENTEERFVTRKDTKFTLDRACDEHARFTRPDLAVCGDDMNSQ